MAAVKPISSESFGNYQLTGSIFKCIDAHTCGNPVRVVVSGGPALDGSTMSEKRQQPRVVAEAFLRDQPQVWKGWVPGEVAARVSASL